MTRARAAVSGLVVVGILALITWAWIGTERSQCTFESYMESGKPYAARVIEELAVLPDELRESSGLAVSRTQPGVLWSHNDSGDGPNLYAIDQSGHLLAVVPVANATARDWEDMAAGPCPATLTETTSRQVASSCLYLADIGDNDQAREELTVYVVIEPRLEATGAKPLPVQAQSFRYRYPDKPTDSEAIAVSPNGDVTIVSKGRRGTAEFFGMSGEDVARALTSHEVLTAEDLGNTGIQPDATISRLVTSAAVSPDGTTLAVRTYNEVFFYRAVKGEEGIRWQDLKRRCFLGDLEPQGEAIDYLDENTLLLTSERSRGRPGTIHRLQC